MTPKETLRNRSSDLADAGLALDSVMEELWKIYWTPKIGRALDALLEGTLTSDPFYREGNNASAWIN
jgi:hypothetical protein